MVSVAVTCRGGRSVAAAVTACAWACAILAAAAPDPHADVDTSTGQSDNTLGNSGTFSTHDDSVTLDGLEEINF